MHHFSRIVELLRHAFECDTAIQGSAEVISSLYSRGTVRGGGFAKVGEGFRPWISNTWRKYTPSGSFRMDTGVRTFPIPVGYPNGPAYQTWGSSLPMNLTSPPYQAGQLEYGQAVLPPDFPSLNGDNVSAPQLQPWTGVGMLQAAYGVYITLAPFVMLVPAGVTDRVGVELPLYNDGTSMPELTGYGSGQYFPDSGTFPCEILLSVAWTNPWGSICYQRLSITTPGLLNGSTDLLLLPCALTPLGWQPTVMALTHFYSGTVLPSNNFISAGGRLSYDMKRGLTTSIAGLVTATATLVGAQHYDEAIAPPC